jgi:hypothetical protein
LDTQAQPVEDEKAAKNLAKDRDNEVICGSIRHYDQKAR